MNLSQKTLAVGDIVTLGNEHGIPRDYRLRPAIVKIVHPAHVTVAVLTSDKRAAECELWPSYTSLLGPVDRRFRLGARVRLHGFHGKRTRINGLVGEVVLDPTQQHHPLWRDVNGVAVLGVAVRVDGQSDLYYLYPRNLEEEERLEGAPAPDVTEPMDLQPDVPKILNTESNMDVTTKFEPSMTTTTTVSSVEEHKAKGAPQQQQQQEPMSRSTTAATMTTTGSTNSNNFEIPDWIIAFSSSVDACVAEIQERQNRLHGMATAKLEADGEVKSVQPSIPFHLLPSVGTWMGPPRLRGVAATTSSPCQSTSASIVQPIAPIADDAEASTPKLTKDEATAPKVTKGEGCISCFQGLLNLFRA